MNIGIRINIYLLFAVSSIHFPCKQRIYLKWGISERFLSSKVEFRRLDCIGSISINYTHTHNKHIYISIYNIYSRILTPSLPHFTFTHLISPAMPLSTYIGGSNNPRRGWAHSLLPSSTTKPLKHRKTRRRAAVKDFLTANFFAVGLSMSLLLFICIIYKYGVPRPITSHFASDTSRGGIGLSRSKSMMRSKSKVSYRKPVDHGGGVASVDITTKELYDKIEFSDVDGGPWKQGWKVTYNGHEWDSEKLKVFVVPHSHNDRSLI